MFVILYGVTEKQAKILALENAHCREEPSAGSRISLPQSPAHILLRTADCTLKLFPPNCWEILNLSWAWENELQMYVLQSKPSLLKTFVCCHWDGLHPLLQSPQTTCFLQKQCQHFIIIIIFFYSEGRSGAGGRERVAVISAEAGLGLRGVRDTQVFSQRALCRALLEPSSVPVCQTTLSRGVRYREPVSNAKASNEGEKKKHTHTHTREEGRWGMWGKRKRGKCSSSKKR